MTPDLVYPLRKQNSTEELRYSLRAACANLAHDRAWVVGRRLPEWASDELLLIAVPDRGTKWENLPDAYRAACAHPDVSEKFVLMNDDFFVLEPVDEMPVLHRGPLAETTSYIRPVGTYGRGYRETEKYLRSIGVDWELLNYEMHAPLPVDRELLAATLERAKAFRGACLQTRTAYGNEWRIGGERSRDVKIFSSGTKATSAALLSTNETSFNRSRAGKAIRAKFAQPSRYERVGK